MNKIALDLFVHFYFEKYSIEAFKFLMEQFLDLCDFDTIDSDTEVKLFFKSFSSTHLNCAEFVIIGRYRGGF